MYSLSLSPFSYTSHLILPFGASTGKLRRFIGVFPILTDALHSRTLSQFRSFVNVFVPHLQPQLILALLPFFCFQFAKITLNESSKENHIPTCTTEDLIKNSGYKPGSMVLLQKARSMTIANYTWMWKWYKYIYYDSL